MPDVGGQWRSMWTQTSKKNISIFFNIVQEVTPGSPTPRKPHINTGICSNKLSLNQQPSSGGFGVPAAAPAETPAPQSSTELPNVETPPSVAEKEKDQQAELEEECTVATITAVADCEAVWKKCVTVLKTADC